MDNSCAGNVLLDLGDGLLFILPDLAQNDHPLDLHVDLTFLDKVTLCPVRISTVIFVTFCHHWLESLRLGILLCLSRIPSAGLTVAV